ncbi:hypothetical protein ASPWEDRAFT_408480 [Aspergillus wentii DTO 134E9]|uniref:Uncharacterized protein n=1 Tax=Aspergillus wentii DTO 134E9 TaxID=1073089 RepID=A0A1L9RNG4_ASPWE|nr:uncharacterized protein ASPWEDRAFT_408480 [Aspergillus wentii DTO 134E9]OJJ36489.1 hypothetical protein ASPWEDRAFT_408480 [Aspergillus wentii DTO 134E9]
MSRISCAIDSIANPNGGVIPKRFSAEIADGKSRVSHVREMPRISRLTVRYGNTATVPASTAETPRGDGRRYGADTGRVIVGDSTFFSLLVFSRSANPKLDGRSSCRRLNIPYKLSANTGTAKQAHHFPPCIAVSLVGLQTTPGVLHTQKQRLPLRPQTVRKSVITRPKKFPCAERHSVEKTHVLLAFVFSSIVSSASLLLHHAILFVSLGESAIYHRLHQFRGSDHTRHQVQPVLPIPYPSARHQIRLAVNN